MSMLSVLSAMVLLALLPAAPAFAWERVETLVSGGVTRSYLLHVPDRLPPGRQALVLVFHGGGGNARNAERMSGMSELAEREGFVVAYPNGSGRLKTRLLTWNSGNCCGYALDHQVDDVGFVSALIDRLVASQPVDANRVYVTGMSNGGMMSYVLGCELAGKVAAIAPVAGAMDGVCRPAVPVSVIAFHGTDDEHVPYAGGEPRRKADSHPRSDRPVRDTMDFWSRRDGCSQHDSSAIAHDVTRDTWHACAAATEVRLYTLRGFGHAWPGGDRGSRWGDNPAAAIDASETMWDFFRDKRSAANLAR